MEYNRYIKFSSPQDRCDGHYYSMSSYFNTSRKLKPDLYYEKSLRHALRQALRQGKPLSQAVASCRNGSSQKVSLVQLLRQHALRHGTRHALRHGKPRSQVGRWHNHVCFPLVALDLRQNSINRPSLLHVAATCRASHVAAIFS